MTTVYVIRSANYYRFYVGITDNLGRRIHEHNQGKTKSTKAYRPWILVLKESYKTRNEARARKKWLKSGIGKEFIKSFWAKRNGT